MKNTKFIPFIVLVAALSACSLSSNGNYPKMKKYSKEVSYETWHNDMEKISKEQSEDSKDMTASIKIGAKMVETRTLDKEKLIDGQTNATGTVKAKYDGDNDVGFMDVNIQATSKEKQYSGDIDYKVSQKVKRYYQVSKIEETDTSISVDEENKEYHVMDEDVQTNTLQLAIMPMLGFAFLPMGYGEETKDQYKFYEDGDMFTVVYTTKETRTDTTNIDGQQVEYLQSENVTTSIGQMEYKKSGGKVTGYTVRYEQKEENTTTYLIDYNSTYRKGMVQFESSDLIFDVAISADKLDLQPIDINGYVDGGEDVDIGLGD